MKACCTLFTFLALSLLGTVAYADDPVGEAAAVIGVVEVTRADSQQTEPLRFRSKLFLNDVVRTDIGGRVKLLLRDKSIIKIGPDSRIVLNKVRVEGSGNDTAIELLKGRLRSVIGEKLGENASYEISTNVAVAGVRGTDFEVLRLNESRTAIRTFEGRVSVRNLEREISGSVLVTPDHFTLVETGTPPEAPAPIGADVDLKRYLSGGDGGKEKGGEEDNGGTEGGGDEKSQEQALDQAEAHQVPEFDAEQHSIEPGELEHELPPAPEAQSQVPSIDGLDEMHGNEQLDTVTEPLDEAVKVPMDIRIPQP